MDKKSSFRTIDGRSFDVTMTWNENFKDADKVFRIGFKAVDRATGRALTLPREIATYAIGSPEETLGERVQYFYGGDRETMMADYLTSAYRRVTDYIQRGH